MDPIAEDGNTLIVPFVFVPKGSDPPQDWLARHPGWIKIPAHMVFRGSRPSLQISQLAADPMSATREMPGEPGMLAAYSCRPVAPVAAERGRTDLVAPKLGENGQANYTMISDTGSVAEKLTRPRPSDNKSHDAPVPFLDDHGNAVLGSDHKQMYFPAGLDPHVFVRQGLSDRAVLNRMLRNPNDGIDQAIGFEAGRLSQFLWWQPWDAQRIGKKYHPEYVDYATVAIGLYAAAAGIPLKVILEAQNMVALFSHFGKATIDPQYPHLRRENVLNTELGYKLFKDHAVGDSKK